MAKKILAIFVVSILLCSYIIPSTSAFADVVIRDNDSYAVTELGVENGKKIATMEAMLQLLESGVSEINFNDISDLEDYLEEFYDELTNVNYTDVSNELLAGAYNDVKELKKWIDDRGEYIATYFKDILNSADEGLSNIFNDFQLKLSKSRLVGTSLNGFRGLSRFNNSDNPVVPPQPNNIQILLDFINKRDNTVANSFFFYDYNNTGTSGDTLIQIPPSDYTWTVALGRSYDNNNQSTFVGNSKNTPYLYPLPIQNLYIISNGNEYSFSHYVSSQYSRVMTWGSSSSPYGSYSERYNGFVGIGLSDLYSFTRTSSGTLEQVLNYIKDYYKNVNIYVDNSPISLVGFTTATPTLNIDGILKLYGNDNPIQYDFPEGTQIDYNALYTTIYNAIRDNLPLDMQTVNNNQVYYDSHDTVYSPTVYNYYGKDGDNENDWIDSILDYATIPDFNAVLGTVAVLDTPFVNGITIVNAGVTDVIPTDILLILGGFFVLVLFVCIINRMSE